MQVPVLVGEQLLGVVEEDLGGLGGHHGLGPHGTRHEPVGSTDPFGGVVEGADPGDQVAGDIDRQLVDPTPVTIAFRHASTGKAEVGGGPHLGWHGLVGRLLHTVVEEREPGVDAGLVLRCVRVRVIPRHDEASPERGVEAAAGDVAGAAHDADDGVEVELRADARRRLEHLAHVTRQPLDLARHEVAHVLADAAAFDRSNVPRPHPGLADAEHAVVDEIPQELAHEEGVAEGLVVGESGEVRACEGLLAHRRREPVRHVLEGERFEHEVRGPRQVALHELPRVMAGSDLVVAPRDDHEQPRCGDVVDQRVEEP